MARRLSSYVYLVDDEKAVHAFGPDDDVPDWAAALITNPAAWADTDEQVDDTPSGDGSAAGPVRPPMNGPGSGLDAWLAHAESLGLDVPANATRGDIITLVEQADAPPA